MRLSRSYGGLARLCPPRSTIAASTRPTRRMCEPAHVPTRSDAIRYPGNTSTQGITMSAYIYYPDGTIVGSDYDDYLYGSSNGEWLLGFKGNDTIRGNGGNDYLEGDDG